MTAYDFRGFRLGFAVCLFLGLPSFISECCLGARRSNSCIVRSVFSSTRGLMVMTDSKNPEWPGWPTDQRHNVGHPLHIHALGQITLLYNFLENFLFSLFAKYIPIGNDAASNIYYSINNRTRIVLLIELVKQREADATLIEYILFGINCYEICTENRNILLHSTTSKSDPVTLVMELRKRAAKDPLRDLFFEMPLPLIRQVADEMGETVSFISNLWYFLHLRGQGLGDEGQSGQPLSLPNKPQKPHKLTPSPPEATPPAG
jgi:hypothetical protein